MRATVRSRRRGVAVATAVALGWLMSGGVAGADEHVPDGTVLEETETEGEFTDGNGACGYPDAFRAPYGARIVETADGEIVLVLDQLDTPDVLVGDIDPDTGIPPRLDNPGKEAATDGVLDGGSLRFDYVYIDADGCEQAWTVLFALGGLLPYFVSTTGVDAPDAPDDGAAPPAGPVATEPAAEPAGGTSDGGSFPWLVVLLVGLGLVGLLVLWSWLRHRAGGPSGDCQIELESWQAAEARWRGAQASLEAALATAAAADAALAAEAARFEETGDGYERYLIAGQTARAARGDADAAAATARSARQNADEWMRLYFACIGLPIPDGAEGDDAAPEPAGTAGETGPTPIPEGVPAGPSTAGPPTEPGDAGPPVPPPEPPATPTPPAPVTVAPPPPPPGGCPKGDRRWTPDGGAPSVTVTRRAGPITATYERLSSRFGPPGSIAGLGAFGQGIADRGGIVAPAPSGSVAAGLVPGVSKWAFTLTLTTTLVHETFVCGRVEECNGTAYVEVGRSLRITGSTTTSASQTLTFEGTSVDVVANQIAAALAALSRTKNLERFREVAKACGGG